MTSVIPAPPRFCVEAGGNGNGEAGDQSKAADSGGPRQGPHTRRATPFSLNQVTHTQQGGTPSGGTSNSRTPLVPEDYYEPGIDSDVVFVLFIWFCFRLPAVRRNTWSGVAQVCVQAVLRQSGVRQV